MTKRFTGTIAAPAAEAASLFGAGSTNVDVVERARQSCPAPGSLDGRVYKFWDLKGDFKSARLTGPKVVYSTDVPGGVVNRIDDYDLDLYALDTKCNLIKGFSSNTAGAHEQGSTKRSVRYIVAVYYAGHEPNIPVTLEVSA